MPARSSETRCAAILMYHRVAEPASDLHGLCVPPAEFRAQMAHLRDACQVVSLSELAARSKADDIVPGSVAVTFDDGYLDNLEIASDVLCELAIPATFFLTTDQLQDRCEYWWDVLERVLIEQPHQRAIDVRFEDGPRSFDLSTPAARLEAYRAVYGAVRQLSPEARQAVVSSLKDQKPAAEPIDSRRVRMSSAEVRELAARPGHAIGAHSVRHLMLPAESADVRRHEIVESGRSLEQLVGVRVDAFAYPFGMFDDDTVESVRDAGYSMALTCGEAPVAGGADLFRLPRWQVAGAARADFKSWLAAAVSPAGSRG